MIIAVVKDPPENELMQYWMQEDPYITYDTSTDAQIFYTAMWYLCITPLLFEQVKSLSSDCRRTYSVDGIEEDARVSSLRASFGKQSHENITAVFAWAFPHYAERCVNPGLLRYPGLPTPASGTPVDQWDSTIMPAVAALPAFSRNNVLTCAYSFFRAYAGHGLLPEAPPWIAMLLVPGDDDADGGAVPVLEPQIPPV